MSDKVADLMLQGIVTNGLKPGDRLPSERELGEQFGVSRTVVREAVRALAAKGVIEARTGSGLRVAAVDAAAVTESMRLFLHGHTGIDYEQVHEVRTMLEVEVAGLAATRATEADVERLRGLCDAMAEAADDAEASSRADVAFHRAIAETTHNPLYVVMLDSIGDVMLEIRRATLGLRGRPAKGVKAHRQILARIAAHDAPGARDAMRKHLADSWRVWQRLRPVEEPDASVA